MVKVTVICDNRDKRILKCQEGNRIWYQLWINPYLKGCIEYKFSFYTGNRIWYWWLRDLQQYYVFFYEKKGGETRGVLGSGNTNKLLGSII